MASAKKKRSADNYLTDQNWDQEEIESVEDNEVNRNLTAVVWPSILPISKVMSNLLERAIPENPNRGVEDILFWERPRILDWSLYP